MKPTPRQRSRCAHTYVPTRHEVSAIVNVVIVGATSRGSLARLDIDRITGYTCMLSAWCIACARHRSHICHIVAEFCCNMSRFSGGLTRRAGNRQSLAVDLPQARMRRVHIGTYAERTNQPSLPLRRPRPFRFVVPSDLFTSLYMNKFDHTHTHTRSARCNSRRAQIIV